MFTLDFTKPLIKQDSFYKIWNNLTKSQQKELCSQYFEFIDNVNSISVNNDNKKFEVIKLTTCFSISYLHSYFNVCSDCSKEYTIVEYCIKNINGDILEKTNTLKEAKSLALELCKTNKENYYINKIHKIIPKDSLTFIDVNDLQSLLDARRLSTIGTYTDYP